MSKYLGDFAEDSIVRGTFNTRALATGAPITLAGSPTLAVYKDGNVSQTTAGVTLTVDFDALTGLHLFTVDTSADAFYSTGSDYRVVITAGTVDGQSVVGHDAASFSIENRNTKANVTQISGDSLAADKLELFMETLNGQGSLSSDSIGSGALTDDAISVDAVTKLQNGLATQASVDTKPNLAAIEASTILAKEATINAVGVVAAARPTLAQIEASTVLAKEATLTTIAGYVDTEVAAVKATTDKLDTAMQLDGSVYRFTANALELAPTGSGGSGPTGDYTLTVTVTDSTTDAAIEKATITLSRSGERAVETTNVSGVAAIGVDAATWTYVVRAAGYESKTGTVVVSNDQSLAVEMDAIVLPEPVNPDMSSLVILCLDVNGDPEAGVVVDIRIVTVPSGDTNIAYKGTKQAATSDVNGYATLQAIKGSVCEYRRGQSQAWSRVTIGEGSTTNVQSIIGAP
jgi:hypothetical protein